MNAIMEILQAHAGMLLDGWLTMQLQTGFFVLIVLAMDMSMRRASPRFRYLLWTTALIKAVIPPIIFIPSGDPSAAGAPFVLPAITVGEAAAGTVAGGVPLSAAAVALLLFASVVFALFVVQRTLRLRLLLGDARPLRHDAWESGPRVYVSSRIPSPLALGTFRPRIFITDDIAASPREVLHAVLHHEHAHIERKDGVVVFLQTLVQIFYLLNPLVWLLNIRLFRYREQICDEEALSRTGTRAVEYGRLLLRYAEAQPAHIVQVGTCFFETRRGFVDRVSQLFSHGEGRRMKRLHRIAIGLLILCIVPLSWKCSDDAPSAMYMQTENVSYERWLGDSTKDGSAFLRLGDPIFSTVQYEKIGKWKTGHGPKIVGGLKALSENVRYPKKAMEEGIGGTVVISAYIAGDGTPRYANVVSSVHPLLDRAAQDAVLSTQFEAARRNGKITEAFISVPIRFKLK